MPPEGPELNEQRELRKTFDADWTVITGVITGSTPIDPTIVDVNAKDEESGILVSFTEQDMLKDCVTQLESKCKLLTITRFST